jgi:hypothetical protein
MPRVTHDLFVRDTLLVGGRDEAGAQAVRADRLRQPTSWSRKQDAIAAEAALDGFYVIRTNLPAKVFPTEHGVLAYKSLSQVERAFRSLKTTDLDIRPIHHRRARRVRGRALARPPCDLAHAARSGAHAVHRP